MTNRKQKSKCVKFIHFISILSLLIGSTFNSSCEKRETDNKPFISFLSGNLPTEITITKGTILILNVLAKSNSETNSKLVRFTVEHKYKNQIQKAVDSSFNADMIAYSYDHRYNSDTGRIDVIFKVEDSLGQTNEARYIVNVYEPRPSINFVKSSGLIWNDTTLPVNTNFRVRINASSNTLTKSRLYLLKVYSDFNHSFTNTITEIIDTEFYDKELTLKSSSEPGIERLTFMIEAKDNAWSSIILNIKTE